MVLGILFFFSLLCPKLLYVKNKMMNDGLMMSGITEPHLPSHLHILPVSPSPPCSQSLLSK